MRTVVVTGACGQLGKVTITRIVQRGYRVFAYDKIQRNDLPCFFCVADFNNLPKEFMWPKEADIVLHLAGFRDLMEPTSKNLKSYLENNLLALGATLSACGDNIKHIIYISSMSVYDQNAHIPTPETGPITPESMYSFSKWLGEQACSIFKKKRPYCGCSIIRLAQVYGIGSSEKLAVYKLINQSLSSAKIRLDCKSSLIRDMIYLDDAAEALALAVRQCPEGIFNVTGGNFYTMGELVLNIEKILNITLLKEFGSEKSENRALDMKKFQKMTGFKPAITLKEGLKREIERIRTEKYNKLV